jgi:heme/copper-type cytochrome/quinol oxidase subunit 2
MGINGNDPEGGGRLTARLTFVVLLGAVLFLPPLIPAAAAILRLGLPNVWMYLFAVWIVLIALVALLVKFSE